MAYTLPRAVRGGCEPAVAAAGSHCVAQSRETAIAGLNRKEPAPPQLLPRRFPPGKPRASVANALSGLFEIWSKAMNSRPKLFLIPAFALALLAASITAHAGQHAFIVNIKRVLVMSDTSFGGCMVLVSESPADFLNCKPNWLTLSCTGDHTDPVRAYQMLDTAKLAHTTEQDVRITFTDDHTHDGYCFVRRIDAF